MLHQIAKWLLPCLGWAVAASSPLAANVSDLEPGWGANFLWFHNQSESTLQRYLDRLQEEGDLGYALYPLWTQQDALGFYRPEPRPVLERMQAAGLKPIVPLMHPPGTSPNRLLGSEASFLQDDLLRAFQVAKRLAYDMHGYVSVYAGPNEPDLSAMRDLPDRVTSFQKALYLGLKAGAAEDGPYLTADRGFRPEDGASIAVLMPPLATGESPWFDEAIDNGLLEYQDGLNVHYYGWESAFSNFLQGVRERYSAYQQHHPTLMADPSLWLTEINSLQLQADTPSDPLFRREQARFLALTANTAHEEGVDVFIPFALKYHRDSNFDMFRSAAVPYPAWQAFSKVTRDFALAPGQRSAAQEPEAINPVVLQWLPAPDSIFQSKAALAYRFRPEAQREQETEEETIPTSPDRLDFQPEFADAEGLMYGELRVYNFSEHVITGFVRWHETGAHRALLASPVEGDAFPVVERPFAFTESGESPVVEVGPLDVVRLPIAFRPDEGPLAEGRFSAEFVTLSGGPEAKMDEQRRVVIAPAPATLSFDLETLPDADRMERYPMAVDRKPIALALPEGSQDTSAQSWPTPRGFTRDEMEGARDLRSLDEDPLPARPTLDALTFAPHLEGPEGRVDIFNTAFPFGYEVTSREGAWHGMNGVSVQQIEAPELGDLALQLELLRAPVYLTRSRVAATMVEGMPGKGVFCLRSDLDLTQERIDLRLMLIDRYGTVWTSLDAEPLPTDPHERWFRWEDFRQLFFGNMRPGAQLQPEDVVSLHISLRTMRTEVPVKVGITFFQDPNLP
ncbi:MAG: hypothetical protein E1N59_3075 [Puniceicoccaceae bacterium 5H]|nr:MAG: hypothetical protein E1N59_3075 [Puniceicoccaceae bacterium 5H]